MSHALQGGLLALVLAACLTGALPLNAEARADEILPPASQRFALETTNETPDFRRHVLPLLGRLGCNGRACHGSFQGQGGFRLSLFGYAFAADHAALTEADSGRVDTESPDDSLILQKPTLAADHKGGKRYEPGGWEHRLLRNWIASGSPTVAEDAAELASLEIEPREIVFDKLGATAQLKVLVTWTDGSREDVTPLCRFRTNDESVAEVDVGGLVTSLGKGDTHIIAFYDNGTQGAAALLPQTDSTGGKYPSIATSTKIDELVLAKLKKLGVVPAERCTDAEFLRRVSLDMTGTLPAPEEVAAFLADESSDKRNRKIDELLERPTYAAWWTTRLCDWTGNSEANLPIGGEQSTRTAKSEQWYDWIYRRVSENTPYDEIVEGIVLARSRRAGQTDEEYFAEMSSYFRDEHPSDFTERPWMQYFWTRGRFTPPQPLRFSYAFLGIRLECAECHKHPYDQWTKEDFDQFQLFFDGVQNTTGARSRSAEMKKELGLTADQDSGQYKSLFLKLAKSGTIVPWQELSIPDPARRRSQSRKKEVSGRVLTPKLLGGQEVLAEEYNDPREPLMEWLRREDNPYFGHALVNRVWANYFGVGLVDPPDDMNLANPPSNAPLLDYLAEGFIAGGYDLKWLHREICRSDTYQRSWRINETNKHDERNFSHALARRLPAEVAYDALVNATAAPDSMPALQQDRKVIRDERAVGVAGANSRFAGRYALRLFGKPPREVNCDCERSEEPSLLQTVYLRNDDELYGLLDRRDGWLKEMQPVGKSKSLTIDDQAFIEQAYLRTLCRAPTPDEHAAAIEHLADAESTDAARRELLWALLNTKEFILNH
jgi:hypothetical protein